MSFYTVIGTIGTLTLAAYAFYAWRQMKRENARFEKHVAAKMALARFKERERLLGKPRLLNHDRPDPKPKPNNHDLPEWWTNP
jgi:hypothetical protein